MLYYLQGVKAMRLYHKKVYWKKELDKALCYLITSDYIKVTNHIKYSTNKWCGHDRINVNKLIAIVYGCKNRTNKHYLFEVETNYSCGREWITKAVIRTEYNDYNDVVIVLRKNTIVTAWLQNKDDRHDTLDKEKYFYPKYLTDK
jgi:hypothetical protein